ncbi:MAG: ABC transporter ATP-binding protein [Chrysiogenetes bacterium]|nr:ABC transporter ATP-binding protein [Chrysiogenetes bacterium]
MATRAAAEPGALVEIRGLQKSYWRGDSEVPVLFGIDLAIARGEFVALMGPSGSGKSTLLNIIAGIDIPSDGIVNIGGRDIQGMPEKDLDRWRNESIGFIFQFYNLIPVFSARENVELPLLLTDLTGKERRERAEAALRIVGLGDRMEHTPSELSGGQQQRVAIARALVNDPLLILADEPTGDLDAHSASEILDLMGILNAEFGKTFIMVTHDPRAAERARRMVHLDKGLLSEDAP